LRVGNRIECIDGIDAEEEWWDGKNLDTGEIGIFPVLFTKGWKKIAQMHAPTDLPTLARQLSLHRGSPALQTKRRSMQPASRPGIIPETVSGENLADAVFSARVIYPYESTCKGELTIEIGEIIEDISVRTGSDQWWEGSGKNGRGQFPCNYVIPLQKDMGKDYFDSVKAKALYDYSAEKEGDLVFKAGDVINLLQCEVFCD
jgi:hypothetical protein